MLCSALCVMEAVPRYPHILEGKLLFYRRNSNNGTFQGTAYTHI